MVFERPLLSHFVHMWVYVCVSIDVEFPSRPAALEFYEPLLWLLLLEKDSCANINVKVLQIKRNAHIKINWFLENQMEWSGCKWCKKEAILSSHFPLTHSIKLIQITMAQKSQHTVLIFKSPKMKQPQCRYWHHLWTTVRGSVRSAAQTGRLCTTIHNRVDTTTTIFKDKFHFSFKTTCIDRVSTHIQVCMARVSDRVSEPSRPTKEWRRRRGEASDHQRNSNSYNKVNQSTNRANTLAVRNIELHRVSPSLSVARSISRSFFNRFYL